MDTHILQDIQNAAARGEVFAYFGYGSLVNRATHRTNILGAVQASVRGWRRHWQARPDDSAESIALLSVKAEDDPDHRLPGLLVFDRMENLASLDAREAGYDRRVLDGDLIEIEGGSRFDGQIYIYEARPPARPQHLHSILQSYLDAVLQGFLHEYGEAEVRRFVTDTHAFDTPILRDRHQPLYPRPVQLEAAQRAFIDATLAENSAKYLDID